MRFVHGKGRSGSGGVRALGDVTDAAAIAALAVLLPEGAPPLKQQQRKLKKKEG